MKVLLSTISLCLLLVGVVPAQDSLNCREKGSWPFGRSLAVAYDASRNLAFLGSGGGVYVLDVANPAQPFKLSEAIHSRGLVLGLYYQANASQNLATIYQQLASLLYENQYVLTFNRAVTGVQTPITITARSGALSGSAPRDIIVCP